MIANESYAADINNMKDGETIVTDENGNVIEGTEVVLESEDYLLSDFLFQNRAVGHMVYRNVAVVQSNGLDIFAGSMYYSEKEKGYTTPFTGTFRQSAWSQNNGSWMLYYARYTGTVSAYLG